ncbi:unnamed protein product [Symbiodinium sp. KB8]|nr:unnamed protein product [Symbiodinium sp. KB8]
MRVLEHGNHSLHRLTVELPLFRPDCASFAVCRRACEMKVRMFCLSARGPHQSRATCLPLASKGLDLPMTLAAFTPASSTAFRDAIWSALAYSSGAGSFTSTVPSVTRVRKVERFRSGLVMPHPVLKS